MSGKSDGRKKNGYAIGRDFQVLDWQVVNTPLGLPGQRQALCTRTFFIPLSEELPPKESEVHYYATSLPAHQAGPERLRDLARGHWGIENRLHHVKDRTWLEDRHWMKNPDAASVMTFLRSVAVGLLQNFNIPGRSGRVHCPEKIEHMQQDPARPVRLVCGER